MEANMALDRLTRLNHAVQQNEPGAREAMLIAAQSLVRSLQTPSEFISSIGWAEPALFACVRTAIDLKIFDTLNDAGGKGMTAAGLAKPLAADVSLVARIMRHLAAMDVVLEPEQGVYSHTKLSAQLTEPKYKDGLIYCYDLPGKSFRSMPSFLSESKYKEPLNPVDGPFQYAHSTKSHFFPWLQENPTYLAAFANYMGGYRSDKVSWFAPAFYPVQQNLVDGYNTPHAPFLVDVGGGKGHDLLALWSQFTDLPGKLVLEDLPEVISSIEPPLPSNIEPVSHDFFTPQPQSYAGARAYFLHSVLHDWDDASCVKILQALKSTLVPGYSKVLVHDLIVPDKGAAWSVTSMDWLMMALGSVKERTESDFRRLFVEAGLEIQKIWTYDQGTESVIEAVLLA